MSQFQNITASLSPWLGYLALISTATFFLSLLIIPLLVNRLSIDYFAKYVQSKSKHTSLSVWVIISAVLKNIAGFLLLMAGVAMLFLPGQGLLTIFLSLLLLSFPGKHRLLIALINNEKIQKSLDWIRKKGDQQLFIWPK